MFRSLLTSCAVLAASAAMAASTVTVTNPSPGSTLYNKQYFDTFNLSASGSYTVAAGASATLECLDTGDVFDSTAFKDFMGAAIIINFDSNEIVENGEYELVVPAGSVLVNGEPCEKLTATYVLADSQLEAGDYPQITLVSSNPASGSGVAAIGADALNRVSFVTSNDAAVNYIGWELWDVTNPNSPEWVYQSSENRIDVNRSETGTAEDRWTNGLYITIGGPDQKLIKGQKYEMKLQFCGIGYNPETNQYPNSQDIAKSLELETSIFFEGLTPGTEYSPYVYESVSPDPANYVIDTAAQAMFTITYSGDVKPDSFIYHRAQGDTPVAGTFIPLNDEDGDGYAPMWEFVVDPSIAASMIGEASFNIVTKDKDGLTLKGNGGYPTDDFSYRVTYEAAVGYPDLVSVAPAEDSTVTALSEIVVGNSDNLVMAYSWNALEPARICDMHGAEIRSLGIPEAVEGNNKQMKWTFDPITASGNYVLIIPKWYFALGEEMDGTTTKVTTFRYTVENGSGETPSGAVFDLKPASVDPADGSTVSEISKVVLTFSNATFGVNQTYPTATLYKVEGEDETEVAVSEPSVDNDWFTPTEYTFTFAKPITEKGTYKFTVAKGAFCDETYDMEMGEAGHANDELVYTFIVGEGGDNPGDDDPVAATASIDYPKPGATINEKSLFETFNLSVDGSYSVAEGAHATLECLDSGDVLESTSFADFMGMAIMIKFNTDDIVENGDYELVIPAGSIIIEGKPCEKMTASYVLSDPNLEKAEYPQITLISSDPADGAGVAAIGAEALNKVSFVTSDDAAVNYITWELWDVTNQDAPEWVYQGNENRIDPNRNETDEDIWTNGLYITIGGPDQKLIKGQKYEMKLAFYGIGYNVETGQYPNALTNEKSLELETSIFFEGLTPGTEYSPYVYESVSPDPDNYEIETAAEAMFTISYSGDVKPASFIYHRAQGDTPVAGTYNPLNDEDGDGYASMWEFVVDPQIAANLVGEASFNITTKDKDGLYLKGNGGYATDDFNYNVVYSSTVGYPDIISVAPEAGATVKSLSEIVVGNTEDLVMAYSWNALEPARICDMHGAEIRSLGIPEAVEGNSKQMKWTFDPITVSGNYVLIIPKWYFALGEEYDGTTTKLTSIAYTVDNGETPAAAVFDITPASVAPADGDVLSEISTVVLTFDQLTFYPMSLGAPVATLVKVADDGVETEVATAIGVENDYFSPTEYTFTFAEPIKEVGTYLFKIEKGAFCDETYDLEMGEAGHANDALVYTYTVNTGLGVDAIVGNDVVNVFTVDGKVILRNASAADVKKLPAGLYIVNGKKLILR